jgi:hypothetical protein
MSYSGGCLCGAVRFEVDGEPEATGYCHCTRCQQRTGTAASPVARVAAGQVRIVQGREALTGYTPPAGGATKWFCATCGSHVLAGPGDDPEQAGAVRMAAFDTKPDLRFSFRQYVADAAPWEPIPDDGVPRYDGTRPTA